MQDHWNQKYLDDRTQLLYFLKAPQMIPRCSESWNPDLKTGPEKVVTLPSSGALLHCTILAESLYLSNLFSFLSPSLALPSPVLPLNTLFFSHEIEVGPDQCSAPLSIPELSKKSLSFMKLQANKG